MFAQRRLNKQQKNNTVSNETARYPNRLNWYKDPPQHTITINEFELAAIARLRILKALETAILCDTQEDQIKIQLAALENQHLPLFANKSSTHSVLDTQRQLDLVSHFVLQLAYARAHDNREWFVRLETHLFKLRLERESIEDRSKFVQTLNLDLEQVSPEEQLELKLDLQAASLASGEKNTGAIEPVYFKIHWTRILDLVARRKCLIRKGFAYITQKDQISLIVNEFKTRLTHQIQQTSRHLPRLDEDERLTPVLNHLSTQYLGKDQFYGTGTELKSKDVDHLASQHFPLCMYNMYTHLNRTGHMKYTGRRHLGLFLKGIGLPVQESLNFWRSKFRNTSDDTFRKEYAYNIRHAYGLEGHRKDYKPFACLSIISQPHPAVGDCHGCPYKTYNPDNLRQLVVNCGVKDLASVNEIVSQAKGGHYQVACTKFAKVKKSALGMGDAVDPIEHPNQYFLQSYTQGGQFPTTIKLDQPFDGNNQINDQPFAGNGAMEIDTFSEPQPEVSGLQPSVDLVDVEMDVST